MKVLLAALLLALPLAAQNADVDVLHYRIEVTVPSTGNEIAATTELTVKPRTIPLTRLALDFGALTIEEVTIDGVPATYARDGEQLVIDVNARELFRARVRYHGAPQDGLFLQPNKFGDRGVFADNWPDRAHHWFPAIDHPSDKASVELLVTAPHQYEVVANGMRLEATALPGGRKLTRWSEPTPIPVYCMVFGAAEMSVLDAEDGVSYYVFPRDRGNALTDFSAAAKAVDLFEDLVGPYPYQKLALVESSTRFGGMENATAIFFDEKRITGKGRIDGLVAHEIAHQWFGDSLTQRDWRDVWLSEGFATYFGNLYFERTEGREAFLREMLNDRRVYLDAYRKKPGTVIAETVTNLFGLLNRNTYEKAGWFLHMLRGVMGDAAFFAGIRDYYAGYRDRNVTTDEFRAVMERHAQQPLGWLFDEWLRHPGHPRYALTWTWTDGKVIVTIDQKQDGIVYRMPAEIEIRTGAASHRETVMLDERHETFELSSDVKPAAVVLDPDEWILKED